jgi:hypothetical protein
LHFTRASENSLGIAGGVGEGIAPHTEAHADVTIASLMAAAA